MRRMLLEFGAGDLVTLLGLRSPVDASGVTNHLSIFTHRSEIDRPHLISSLFKESTHGSTRTAIYSDLRGRDAWSEEDR